MPRPRVDGASETLSLYLPRGVIWTRLACASSHTQLWPLALSTCALHCLLVACLGGLPSVASCLTLH